MSTPLTMSVEEVADTLKIHRNSVRKLIQDGAIPAGKSGRAYIILTRDVLAYAEQIIMKQTADRLVAAGRAQRSPHRRRKVTGAQVSVAH